MIRVSPSILAADFANLEREIGTIKQAGAEYVHIDVMDGLFDRTDLAFQICKICRQNLRGYTYHRNASIT